MTVDWKKLGMKFVLAAVLLGTMALSACATSPTGPSGLYDSSSDNGESVPYDAWFKDRPQ